MNPVPETLAAILIDEKDYMPAWHQFSHAEVLDDPDGLCVAFVFKSERTGTLKRWGFEAYHAAH